MLYVKYFHKDDLTIGIVRCDIHDMYKATTSSYKLLYDVIDSKYLIKCHNHIPSILDNYFEFNRGRLDVFRDQDKRYKPAACGLGELNGSNHLVIHFIASDIAPVALDNPRQINAYEYPEKFGPSPMFSRAVLHNNNLYVSGTASIVGSETAHVGDIELQKLETLRNIEALAHASKFDMSDLEFVVYYKNQSDLLNAQIPYKATYKHCCICRDDLLIEIEATSKNGYKIHEIYS